MYLLLKHSVLLSLSGTWKHVKTCLLYVCSVMCVVIWYNTLCHFAVHAHVLLLSSFLVCLDLSIHGLMVWLKLYIQFASVSSMSDIVPTYMHTCIHTQFHTNRHVLYSHLCTHTHKVIHFHTVQYIVYRTLLVIFPIPYTMVSWASAAFGGSVLVGKMLFWQGRLL